MLNKIKEIGKKIREKASDIWDDHKDAIGLGAILALDVAIILASVRTLSLYNRNQKLDYKLKMAQLNNK